MKNVNGANPSAPATRLRQYVLFGPPRDPATQVHLMLAQDYLIAGQTTFGFSADEAVLAQRVTIIGDESAVDAATAQRLAAAGCKLERVQGSVDEVARALERLARGGRGT